MQREGTDECTCAPPLAPADYGTGPCATASPAVTHAPTPSIYYLDRYIFHTDRTCDTFNYPYDKFLSSIILTCSWAAVPASKGADLRQKELIKGSVRSSSAPFMLLGRTSPEWPGVVHTATYTGMGEWGALMHDVADL